MDQKNCENKLICSSPNTKCIYRQDAIVSFYKLTYCCKDTMIYCKLSYKHLHYYQCLHKLGGLKFEMHKREYLVSMNGLTINDVQAKNSMVDYLKRELLLQLSVGVVIYLELDIIFIAKSIFSSIFIQHTTPYNFLVLKKRFLSAEFKIIKIRYFARSYLTFNFSLKICCGPKTAFFVQT